ncbi:TadE/TadG family type IV pilus assembly protein [Acetobacter fallax]|uniref:Pilus assembly protein n=1 Tax=Acetobacter fallax TaxID=1737473 RepID=A0ABX0K742_9PROT|nr:TadE/TadG family type IV pilus assembly protein [Acetobacter fallax]NHO31730.1 pilus assembly protein [Acetobacter fallax]NHO35289.1 pilus assembly protein [Acetobacter fallax]
MTRSDDAGSKNSGKNQWQRFLACRRGVSAVEFALLAPILITMFVGGTEIEEAVVVLRKVTSTSYTVANLTTQYDTMTTDDAAIILEAAQMVLQPYPTSSAQTVVSEISVGSSGQGTIIWSCGLNHAPHTLNANITLPAGTDSSGSAYLIYGESWYSFTPPVISQFMPTVSGTGQGNSYSLPMYENLYMVPRQSTSIPLTAGSNTSSGVTCTYPSSS